MKIKARGSKLDFTATAAATASRAISEDQLTGEVLSDPSEGRDLKAVARVYAGVWWAERLEPRN